jgi:hypothetical protein
VSEHPIGRGIVALIQQHEPDAVKAHGDPAARVRVLRDLADSIGGLLAFTMQMEGPDAARVAAILVIDRMSTAAPDIVRRAQAEMKRGAQ